MFAGSPNSDANGSGARLPREATWGDWTFIVDQPAVEVDAWVVLDDIHGPQRTRVPPGNTLLLTGEPPSIRNYRASYLQQFSHVITCHASLVGSRLGEVDIHLAPQGLPWHLGVDRMNQDRVQYGYEDLIDVRQLAKSGLISVICSNKTITRDHRARLNFVKVLENHFGSDIAVFGRGFREIGDKWDAIAPFRFHVVLENDFVNHYFSEKLTDCFLAQSYPLYYGCPNAAEYFSTDSFTAIDIHQPQHALETIQKALDHQLDHKNAEALRRSRDRVLEEYNLFSIIRRHFSQRFSVERPRNCKLYPRRHKWSLQWARLQRFRRRLLQAV